MKAILSVMTILLIGIFSTNVFAVKYVPINGFFGIDIVIPVETTPPPDTAKSIVPIISTLLLGTDTVIPVETTPPPYAAPTNTIAMSYGRDSLTWSKVLNGAAPLLIPTAALLVWRRRTRRAGT